jgi:hypothetical protein
MEERSNIEKLIWYEMVHAKYWEQYLSDYSGYKIDYRKWSNIIILLFSTIGASSWAAWKLLPEGNVWVPSIIFAITGVTQLISIFQKNVVADNGTLQSLYKLRTLYISYFNKLEKLFIELDSLKYSEKDLIQKYYELRETVYPIEELKDALNINQMDKIDKKIMDRVNNYLEERFQ